MGVTVWMREERGGKINDDCYAIQGNDLHKQPRRSIIKTMKHYYIIIMDA